MRQPTTAEVRLDEHKAAVSAYGGRAFCRFGLSTSRLRSNSVAADPPATEDHVQRAGYPENVGCRLIIGEKHDIRETDSGRGGAWRGAAARFRPARFAGAGRICRDARRSG